MKNNMVCPGCGGLGFASKEMWATANNLKCSECGAWSEPSRWEKVKTGAKYRADIATLRAEFAQVEQERDDTKAELQVMTRQATSNLSRAEAAEQDRDRLAGDVEQAQKENAERDEFTVKRVRVLAKVLDCEPGLPDDATIIGCMGTILGMFRARSEVLKEELTAAQQAAQEQFRKGMERAAEICNGLKVCGLERGPIGDMYIRHAALAIRAELSKGEEK